MQLKSLVFYIKLHKFQFINLIRFEQLTENIWQHDIILHEAGIPPIHTPISVLSVLPQEIKDKLYLVITF